MVLSYAKEMQECREIPDRYRDDEEYLVEEKQAQKPICSPPVGGITRDFWVKKKT